MKILLAGAWNPAFEAAPDYLKAALERAGHEVVRFDLCRARLPDRLRSRIRVLDLWDRNVVNRRLIQAARGNPPHLLFVTQGSILSAETIETVRRETGASAVNWWSSHLGESEDGLSLAGSGAYDVFLASGSDAVDRHRRAGVHETRWLPPACDPFVHRPLEPAATELERYRCRVAFVGSANQERRAVLASVADLGLAVWGPGWDRYTDDPEIGSCIRGGPLRPREWVRVYSAADVVLNVSRAFGGLADRYGTEANARVFEALACGACQVTDGKRDVTESFRDGEHLLTFRTLTEARAHVESLLGDSARRRYLAVGGRREALARHTWNHRVETVMEHLEAARDRGRAESAASTGTG